MTEPQKTLGEELAELRDEKIAYREADKEAKRLKKIHDTHQYRIIERMERERCKSYSDGDTLFVSASTTMANVQDREAFVAWAKEHDEALLDPLPKERGELLNQLVRERLDNGEPLPPGIGFYVREYISHNKA